MTLARRIAGTTGAKTKSTAPRWWPRPVPPPEQGCAAASPSDLSEQVNPVPHLFVVVAIRTVEERLTLADGQITAANQAVVEQPVGALLEVWAEVDEHVRADDEVEVVERSVGDQAVASPRDAVLQPQIEPGGAASDE